MAGILRCVLLDDELPGLAYLRMLCEQLEGVEVVRAFNDPLKFLNELSQLEFEVCVLDIRMPGMNGLDVGKHLGGKALIFTTAHAEYAADAFDMEAVDYIRKPIQATRLEKAFQKAGKYLELRQQDQQLAEFNSNKGKVLLHFADIGYIGLADSDRRDKKIRLKNNQEMVLKNISFHQLLAVLPGHRFCRINRSTILALDTVQSYTHDHISTNLTDDDGLPLSFTLNEAYRSLFRAHFKT